MSKHHFSMLCCDTMGWLIEDHLAGDNLQQDVLSYHYLILRRISISLACTSLTSRQSICTRIFELLMNLMIQHTSNPF